MPLPLPLHFSQPVICTTSIPVRSKLHHPFYSQMNNGGTNCCCCIMSSVALHAQMGRAINRHLPFPLTCKILMPTRRQSTGHTDSGSFRPPFSFFFFFLICCTQHKGMLSQQKLLHPKAPYKFCQQRCHQNRFSVHAAICRHNSLLTIHQDTTSPPPSPIAPNATIRLNNSFLPPSGFFYVLYI